MNIVWILVVIGLAAGGVRSFLYWQGRGVENAADSKRMALYAAFVAGRVGLWFAVAAVVGILAAVENPGAYRWLLVVPGIFALEQIVTAFMLGSGAPPEDD